MNIAQARKCIIIKNEQEKTVFMYTAHERGCCMELISIIPGFQPKNDAALLRKAEALKPELIYTDHDAPAAVWINGQKTEQGAFWGGPLRRGDQAVLDFGRHLVGRLTLSLDAAGSHQDAPAYIRVEMMETRGEMEEKAEAYDGWLSRSWIQQEQMHVDLLPAELCLPRRYAFRYVRLTVLDTSPKFQVKLRGAKCRAESAADWKRLPARSFSDPELQSIYEASLLTLAECTQTVLEDGPKRDQRLWLGDLRLQALTTYVSFRNEDLVKRCLYLFAGSRFPDGRMSANVFEKPEPAADDTYLLDYALLFPVALRDYMEQTGDREALGDLLAPALEQIACVLAQYTDGEGALLPEAGQTGFIDWSDCLDKTASLQGVLICALDAAATLCDMDGDQEKARHYARLAADSRQAAFRRFWNEKEGCFLSGGQRSIHSQVWMTLAGLMPEGKAGDAFDKALSQPGAPSMATPYMHHYYVMALLKSGLKSRAEKHLKSYWGGMLRAGADTFWECFDPGDPGASPYGGRIVNSFCHAWSCTPAFIIERYFT